MASQFPATESTSPQGLNLFSAKSVKFWGLGGAALASLMLFPDGHTGDFLTGLSVIGAGAFLFWSRLKPHSLPTMQRLETLSREDLTQRFTEIANLCNQIEAEAQRHPQLESTDSIRQMLTKLQSSCDRTQLNLVITGDRGVGKTEVCSALMQADLANITLAEQSWSDVTIPDSVLTADLILFIAHGDLTQSELDRIQSLKAQYKPMLVILNKIDQLMPSQLENLTEKFQQILGHQVLGTAGCLAIAASPQPIVVRRHQSDGSFEEVQEQPAPQLSALMQALSKHLDSVGRQQLVWQQVYGETLKLRERGLRSLHAMRRQRAIPLIEKYQWISASAAFASPLPSTDMIAAAAITGKLVTDLGEIYEHRFSVSEAQNIAAILAQALLKLGLVELSSQLLGVALKSHAATYVAGGLVQGLSVAYLTQIAGLSLIEHFEAIALGEAQDSQLSLQSVKQIVERVFAQNQRIDFLKGLVGQGISRLQPAS